MKKVFTERKGHDGKRRLKMHRHRKLWIGRQNPAAADREAGQGRLRYLGPEDLFIQTKFNVY